MNSSCRNTHDTVAYLAAKPKDIRFPLMFTLSDTPPFVSPSSEEDEKMAESGESLFGSSVQCPVFEATGDCRYGLKCRFLGGHSIVDENGNVQLVVNQDKKAIALTVEMELNTLDGDILKQIRSKKVDNNSEP
jgi:tRNA-dihydrouridine synthase 3